MIRKIDQLKNFFTKRSISGALNAFSNGSAGQSSALVYSLETPQFHLLRLNAMNRFSGFVFDCNSKPVDYLNIYLDDKKLGSFKVDGVSDDVFEHVPHIVDAKNCRFDFDLYIKRDASNYLFEVVYDDKSCELLFEYNVAQARSLESWLKQTHGGLAHIPMPNADLVYLTQGIRDSMAYQNSIIPGIYNMKRYLINSGIEINSLQSILDLGCGTGRLIVGWYLDNPKRKLFGCDINGELLAWAMDSLPKQIKWDQSSLNPPLPYPSNCFDLIYLVSVFTHLSLASQYSWIEELKRIVRPHGYIMISLQGEIYVNLFQPKRVEEFSKTGYIETVTVDEGSNSFGTYHCHKFVEELFADFEIVGYYPRGRINYPEVVFPVAAFQDVYVLKCRS
ncbi:MAG: class I SAM-dependent methyltransferase [Desulfobacteraceae bacterium]|nr:class I SAM-dependent methyltransferase [Desulfobacteraceae bacterium]